LLLWRRYRMLLLLAKQWFLNFFFCCDDVTRCCCCWRNNDFLIFIFFWCDDVTGCCCCWRNNDFLIFIFVVVVTTLPVVVVFVGETLIFKFSFFCGYSFMPSPEVLFLSSDISDVVVVVNDDVVVGETKLLDQ